MIYVLDRNNYNESIKSRIATTLLASIISFSNLSAKDVKNISNDIEIVDNKLHNYSTDSSLNQILDEIKGNIHSDDSLKFKELFSKLSSKIEKDYGYKIEVKKVENVDQLKEEVSGMDIFELLGWMGSICLAICGLPQAWQSFKEKNSDGISWGFLLLWAFGELFALAYVYPKSDIPLLLNYFVNMLIVSIILFYKIRPVTPK